MLSLTRHELLVICQYPEQGPELTGLLLGPVMEGAFSISNFYTSLMELGQLCDTFAIVFY